MKIILVSFLLINNSFAVEGHKDHEGRHETNAKVVVHKDEHKDEHDDHGKQNEHEEHDDHQEKNASKDGFSLNEKSIKTFDLKFIKYIGPNTIIPQTAIYKGLNEVNLYRKRNGLFKRIDFKTLKIDKNSISVSSSDLIQGDQIVVAGVGFLRMAEIAASGGLSDSHSH
jgi:hypothetical protein